MAPHRAPPSRTRRRRGGALASALVVATLVLAATAPAVAAMSSIGPDRAAGARIPSTGTTVSVPDALVGSLDWPVPPAGVLRAFAPPASRWGPGHRGIDVAAAPGRTVTAATAGTVSFAGTVVDRPVVTIRMSDVPWEVLVTVEPVAPSVAEGDVVAQGAPIGTLVPGHRPCGACVHLGVRIDDAYANPMAMLGAERSVLLPLDDPG